VASHRASAPGIGHQSAARVMDRDDSPPAHQPRTGVESHRGGFPDVDHDPGLAGGSRRNPLMVLGAGHHRVLPLRAGVHRDPLAAIQHIHLSATIPHPPHGRHTATAPNSGSPARTHKRPAPPSAVPRPGTDTVAGSPAAAGSTGPPPNARSPVRGSYRAPAGWPFPHPGPQLCVEIIQAAGLASLQPTQKIPADVLYARFDPALGLRPVRPAEPGREAPIAGEVQKYRVPDDLTAVVPFGPGSRRVSACLARPGGRPHLR